ncbi:MAG: cellulase family glycosylhydrolase [Allobranchiibius sp.]
MSEINRRSTRRTMLTGAAAAAVGVGVVPQALAATNTTDHLTADHRRPKKGDPSPKRPFVTTRNGNFMIGRDKFRFAGTNTYYLHQQSHYMIDAALDDAAKMALPVIRAWAFADGLSNTIPMQPQPYTYDEAAFDSLDYAVWRAGQLGIRLSLGFTNNWSSYGGMPQYVSWFLGLADDEYGTAVNHDKFYTTASIKKCYKAWVKHVVTRVNPYTGLRYNQDPTIMTWELANEPRNRSDKTGKVLLAWAREMSAYVKSVAPRQLVALGDEGFYGEAGNTDYPYSDYEGNHWKELTALPDIDYGTVHMYPQSWGTAAQADPIGWGTKWITDHIRDGKRLGKPVMIEEFGLTIEPGPIPDAATRTSGYQTWTTTVLNAGGAADMFWLLTSRNDDGSFYANYDTFRIIWYPSDPSYPTAQVLSNHAKVMAGVSLAPNRAARALQAPPRVIPKVKAAKLP